LEEDGNDCPAEGQAQTERNVVFVRFLELEGFIDDLSRGEEVERNCKE
jgi:hypothetical protein